MTPHQQYAYYIANESKIKAVTAALITSIAMTTIVMLILSPVLIPLWIMEKTYKGIKATWNWLFPEPQGK